MGRRQDTASNQLLSHALEQLLAQAKRRRDTRGGRDEHAAWWRCNAAATFGRSYIEGSADALRTLAAAMTVRTQRCVNRSDDQVLARDVTAQS